MLPVANGEHHPSFNVKVLSSTKKENFLKGDFIIYLNQPVDRYIVEMLEPSRNNIFFPWNFF